MQRAPAAGGIQSCYAYAALRESSIRGSVIDACAQKCHRENRLAVFAQAKPPAAEAHLHLVSDLVLNLFIVPIRHVAAFIGGGGRESHFPSRKTQAVSRVKGREMTRKTASEVGTFVALPGSQWLMSIPRVLALWLGIRVGAAVKYGHRVGTSGMGYDLGAGRPRGLRPGVAPAFFRSQLAADRPSDPGSPGRVIRRTLCWLAYTPSWGRSNGCLMRE